MAKKNKKRSAKKKNRTVLIVILAAVLCLAGVVGYALYRKYFALPSGQLSSQVLSYRDEIEKEAAENGISEYVPVLLAIMQVESGGRGEDVMQASESLGLSRNTLDTEASIRQGCAYFAELLKAADRLGCDLDCVIQAYNYGEDFLDYAAAENGGVYSFEIASAFAEQKAEGVKTKYRHPLAMRTNLGWRYQYGNMFYVQLVHLYLPEAGQETASG